MFVYSVRASTLRFGALIAAVLTLFIFLINVGGIEEGIYASVGGVDVNYGGIKTNEDRVKFIEGFGILVKDEPVSEELFTAPDSFDRIISGYNEIQKTQGLDLSKYKGKRITHYAYEVENYLGDGNIHANLYVYKGRIVACDVSSVDGGSFLSPIVGVDKTLFGEKK